MHKPVSAVEVRAWNPDSKEIRAGQFDADPGFEHWLLKFDGMGADRELGTAQTIAGTGYVGISNAIFLAQHNQVLALGITMFNDKEFQRTGHRSCD